MKLALALVASVACWHATAARADVVTDWNSTALVVATFRAVMNPGNPVPTRLGLDQVADIRALDANTLRVRLRQ
jgi:hypothetical protein